MALCWYRTVLLVLIQFVGPSDRDELEEKSLLLEVIVTQHFHEANIMLLSDCGAVCYPRPPFSPAICQNLV